MLDRDNLHDRILNMASCEFTEKGIKAVRMDDIARKLGISKRTLYETFPNKEDLLLECVRQNETKRAEYMHDFYSDPRHNAIEVVLEHYKHTMKIASVINANYIVEIRNYKKVVDYFDKCKQTHQSQALQFMQKGVEEGFFRADVDYNIMLNLSDSVMESLINKRFYSIWDVGHLFHNVFFMFFRGICTPRGLEIIDSFITDRTDAPQAKNGI